MNARDPCGMIKVTEIRDIQTRIKEKLQKMAVKVQTLSSFEKVALKKRQELLH